MKRESAGRIACATAGWQAVWRSGRSTAARCDWCCQGATRPQYGGTLRVEVRQNCGDAGPAAAARRRIYHRALGSGTARRVRSRRECRRRPPFLDGVEILLGRALRDQASDLDLGKADVVELGPNELRRQPAGRSVWSSSPVRVLALVFAPRFDDARVREALALAVDRSAIHTVLLQRQGEVSGALLPQWLSGYAFLFPAAADLGRARQLAAGARPITLGVTDAAAAPHRRAHRAQRARCRAGRVRDPADRPTPTSRWWNCASLRRTRRRRWPQIAAALGLPDARARADIARTDLRRGARPAGGLSRHPADSPARRLRRRPAGEGRPRHHALGGVALREPLAGRRAAMRFRTRLLLIFTVAIVAAVAVVDLLVLGSTRQAFERSEAQRADALVLQFRNEFDRRRRELVRTVNAIAASEATRNIAIQPDYSPVLRLRRSAGGHPRSGSAGTGGGRWRHREQRAMAGALRLQGRVAHQRRGLEDARRVPAARGTAAGRDARAGGGGHGDRGRPQTLRRRRARTGPRVPLHAGAARRDAGPALSQPGSAFHAGGTDRRGGSRGECRRYCVR